MTCPGTCYLILATVLLGSASIEQPNEYTIAYRPSDIWIPKVQDILLRCLLGTASPTLVQVRKLWYFCAKKVLSSCMLRKPLVTESSELSAYCGWIVMTSQTHSELPATASITLLPGYSINVTFTEFRIPWFGPGCPEMGLHIKVRSGNIEILTHTHCGSRLPWSVLVSSSKAELVAYGDRTATPYIHVVASYQIMELTAPLTYQRQQLIVHAGKDLPPFQEVFQGLTLIASSLQIELRNDNWPVTWHIVTDHSRYIRFEITKTRIFDADVTLYDGPGKLSKVLDVDQAQLLTKTETTAFHAMVDVATASLLADVTIHYWTVSQWHRMEEDLYSDCRQPAWYLDTLSIDLDGPISKASNTMCMTRLHSLELLPLEQYHSSVELTIDFFRFQGPRIMDEEEIRFFCQYGGLYLYFTTTDYFQDFTSVSFCDSDVLAIPNVLVLNHPVLFVVWFSGYSHGHLTAALEMVLCAPQIKGTTPGNPALVTLPRYPCHYVLLHFKDCGAEGGQGCQVDFEMARPLLGGVLGPELGLGDMRIGSVLVRYIGPAAGQTAAGKGRVIPDVVLFWVLDSGDNGTVVLRPGIELDWRNVTLRNLNLSARPMSWHPGFLVGLKIQQFAAYGAKYRLEDGDISLRINTINYFSLINPYSNSKKSFYLTARPGYRLLLYVLYAKACPVRCKNDKFVITETYKHTKPQTVITWTSDQIPVMGKRFYYHVATSSGMLTVQRQTVKRCFVPDLKNACELKLNFLHPAAELNNASKGESDTVKYIGISYTLYRPSSRYWHAVCRLSSRSLCLLRLFI